MASVRFLPGKGFRIEWHVTIKHGPHKGKRQRGSQLVRLKDTPANRKLAEKIRLQREIEAAELAAGITTPIIAWSDFLGEYYREKAHQKTIDIAIRELTELGQFGRFKTTENFTGQAVSGFIDNQRKKGKTPATIRKILNNISAAMTYAHNKRYITYHPFKSKEIVLPPKAIPRERFLTRDEFARLLRMCRDLPTSGGMTGKDREHAMMFAWHCIFIVNTGLRISEYITAKRSDLHQDRITVYGKGKKGQPKRRTVTLNHQARWALQHLGRGQTGLAFPYCNRRSWYTKYRRWFGRAGIENIGPHILRKSFGSWLCMAGTPLNAVQKLMGHSSIVTTINHYSHLTPEFLRGSTSNLRYHTKIK